MDSVDNTWRRVIGGWWVECGQFSTYLLFIFHFKSLSSSPSQSCFSLRGRSNSMPLSYGYYGEFSCTCLLRIWCHATATLLKILCAGAHILVASLLKGRLHTYLMHPDAVPLKIHEHLHAYFMKVNLLSMHRPVLAAVVQFLQTSSLVTFQFDPSTMNWKAQSFGAFMCHKTERLLCAVYQVVDESACVWEKWEHLVI